MHKIAAKEFTIDDFSHEHLFDVKNDEPSPKIGGIACTSTGVLKHVITALNYYREYYLSMIEQKVPGANEKAKDIWYQMIQLLPSSYNQKRTVMLNYEVLANIYKYRKNHKLDEWVELCKWIETLPYSELITGPGLKDIPMCNKIMQEAETRVKCEPLANGPDMTGSVKE